MVLLPRGHQSVILGARQHRYFLAPWSPFARAWYLLLPPWEALPSWHHKNFLRSQSFPNKTTSDERMPPALSRPKCKHASQYGNDVLVLATSYY